MDTKERVEIASRAEWRAWLAENHTRPTGIWLVRYKKHTGSRYVHYDDIVEEALCFGWIDSQGRKLDDERSLLWMSPRKPGSGWSKVNKERIERMTAAGLMTRAGLDAIEAARQDGSWSALDAVETLEIPPDLGAALDAYPDARKYFEAFPKSARRAILEWISNAKRDETRAKRIEEAARLAQENVRANQWRPKKS